VLCLGISKPERITITVRAPNARSPYGGNTFTYSFSKFGIDGNLENALQQCKGTTKKKGRIPHYISAPADLHHRTCPSWPPLMNAPAEPGAAGFGDHETLHTSTLSWSVETAARADKSHTLIVLSADLEGLD
jgi:hypothetical protein